MLRRLTVKNLAIVEDLEIELSEGLTVITGETGAGKSILVDALSLISGGRGSSDLVRQGASRLLVVGEFEADGAVRSLLAQAGLPPSAPLLLRRELSPDGRGRAFVEDEPASVRTLARIGECLISIYGQNSELELVDTGAPLEILDTFAKAETERRATEETAARWMEAREKREALEASRRERGQRLEMLEFQIREIELVSPLEQEEPELSAERGRLLHADKIRRAGETALSALSEDEASAADRLGEAARAFAELAAIDPREEPHREEAEELKRRIADLAAAARNAATSIEADSDRLTALETRLESIARLKRKYGGSVAQVLERLAAFRSERAELSNIEDVLESRMREEAVAKTSYLEAASALSGRRRAAAPRFSAAVERELGGLAMEKARFRVGLELVLEGSPRASGLETASFLFTPNPGEAEKPLEKIASGGELARLQLAIRTAAAGRKRKARTLVFDEVDAGIGGRVAEVVGKRLRDLAAGDQVLCVTHVPQIAALADRHFLAEKREVQGRTIASVRLLEGRERVAEIARMLAGEEVPETALKHARTLLEAAAR
ncbi:MAG TPA: DNA repair protein RecN [Thermoanaerobaculia bacterium]